MASHAVSQGISKFGDQAWRLNNLYWITTKEGKEELFRMNWAQEALYWEMHYLNVILKARQLGFTTLIQLYMLDTCLFNSNVSTGVIAHNREDAEDFFKKKIKFAYDNLEPGIRAAVPAVQDSARTLDFANKSSIRVGTSMRSGTYQMVHISEFGKICAQYPSKAREIRTGTFNTVHAGQKIFVESTAEGQDGDFFQMCENSQAHARRGSRLTDMDFKFFFFPWFKHPAYSIDPEGVVIEPKDQEYFGKLAKQGIALTDGQKAWYVKKALSQKSDMKREFPSTPKEAFEAAIAGAYYAEEMAGVESAKRIAEIPHTPGVPVETWWDLGMNDTMSIGFIQRVGEFIHFIDYYEYSGTGLQHYATMLQDKQRERKFVYGDHVWPHDGKARILDEKGRKRSEVMADLGYDVEIVKRGEIAEGIEATRKLLAKCKFDEVRCAPLVKAIKNYRREWDEDRATWRDKPLHNWASHPADMVRTGAMFVPRKKDFFRKITPHDVGQFV